jgi:hypothetical protein
MDMRVLSNNQSALAPESALDRFRLRSFTIGYSKMELEKSGVSPNEQHGHEGKKSLAERNGSALPRVRKYAYKRPIS